MKLLIYGAGLIASLILGFWLSRHFTQLPSARSDASHVRPAYLIASWNTLQPDKLKPFVDAAVPLAQKAGFEMLASGKPQVLEGNWPYKGTVLVQRYTSMNALLKFWRSPEHEAAKKLREGYVESNFVIAVEEAE